MGERPSSRAGPDAQNMKLREVEMIAQDIMTPNYQAVVPQTPLREAARQMDELNVGMLPVSDGNRLLGVITDRDIVVRAVAAGADPMSAPVSDYMTENVASCPEDWEIGDVARLMEDRQVRRVIVMNSGRHPVGVLSTADMATTPESSGYAGEILREVSKA